MSAAASEVASKGSAPAALRLASDDNVAVALRSLAVGEQIVVDGVAIAIAEAIELGHKLAMAAIPKGGLVRKFGMPIGAASTAIAPGSWVHVHNIRSLWLTNDRDTHTAEGST